MSGSPPIRLVGPRAAVLAVAAVPAALLLLRSGVEIRLAPLLGLTLLTSVALAVALLAVRPRWSLAAAWLVVGLSITATVASHVRGAPESSLAAHDGGVVVTRAAAERLANLENPYVADFTGDLAPDWLMVTTPAGDTVPNPLVRRFPYLPGAALVHVPPLALASALGLTYDPRVLYVLVLAGALALAARSGERREVRAAAVLGIGNPFVAAYLGWGTNDAAAASLVIVAIALAATRPRTAALLVAAALSMKVTLVLALPILALAVAARQGRRALARWWPLPVALTVTSAPFLVLAPGPFLADTAGYHLGTTSDAYPPSGYGLPAAWPDLLDGPAGALTALVATGAGLALGAWVLRRSGARYRAVGPAGGITLLVAMLGYRSFVAPYVTLVVTLAGSGWLLLDDRAPGAWLPAHDGRRRQRDRDAPRH